MAIIAYPLNNIEYTAEDAMLSNLPISSGVYAAEDNFDISLNGGMSLSLGTGLAFIRYTTEKGFTVYLDRPEILAFDPSDNVLSRIDRVVLQWVEADNKVNITIKKGTPASTPVPPDRSATASVYELVLYDVRIGAGVTSLSNAAITDQRLNKEVCGLMANNITKIDTSAINAQIESLISTTEEKTQQLIENADAQITETIETKLQEAKDSGEFKGDKGDKGDTPIRGTDYWTTADQNAIINEVLTHFTDVSEVGM